MDGSHWSRASDRITNAGFAYDANGNLLSDGVKSYEYDPANRLTKVISGSVTIDYAYDGWGNLILESSNGITTEYVLDERGALPTILGEVRSDGVERLYAYGAEDFTAQMTVGGSVEYPLLDGLGSMRQLTDNNGTIVLYHSYDAFGIIRVSGGVGNSRLGYTGELQDTVTGLVYLRARFYHPVLGRFLQRDSFAGFQDRAQSLNRYAYTENNPVNLTDPSGQFVGPSWLDDMLRSHLFRNYVPRIPDLTEFMFHHLRKGGCGPDDTTHEQLLKMARNIADILRPDDHTYFMTPYGPVDDQHFVGGQYKASQIQAYMDNGQPFTLQALWFHADYQITLPSDADQKVRDGVVIGILLDFERRFEMWQGTAPGISMITEGLKHSSFSMEDLFSDYLGATATLQGKSLENVLDELGGVTATLDTLPCDIRFLQNASHQPMIPGGIGYIHVPLPPQLTIEPIYDEDLWQYQGSRTELPLGN